jgi:hypothetical protein
MRFFQILFWLMYASLSLADPPPPKDWALSTSLGNSIGIGTFVADYARVPSWTTSLSINPSYQIPQFWGLPRISVSAFEMLTTWWLNSYRTTDNDAQNRLALSDLNLNVSMPEILNFESTGFSLGANLGLQAPVSTFSRNINRILGFSADMPVSWSKWGFHARFTPSVSAWAYSDTNIRVPCLSMSSPMVNPYDASADIGQMIQGLSIVRNGDERLGDGQCLAVGRQNIWSLNNGVSLGWSNPNHSVSVSLNWMINFLRPLADRPELRNESASGQNFTEATSGRIAYAYTLPIETNLVLSAGVMSWQSSLDSAGRVTFPFFDFVTPGNNQTQIFVQATVGI